MLDKRTLQDGLTVLASIEEQQRLWLSNDDTEMSLFDEEVCYVFGDSGLTHAMDSGWLAKNRSEEFCETARQLNKAVSRVPAFLAPEEVIAHVKMHEVRRLAKKLLELIKVPLED